MSNPVLRRATVPLNDLSRWSAKHADEIAGIAHKIASSGRFLLGPELEAFETEFAQFHGARHCLGVSNGTDALELALRAIGISAGDQVLTVANAGMYAAAAIVAAGGRPVFVDIDPVTMTMCPRAALDAVKPGVKGLIVTHLYGTLAHIEELASIGRNAGLFVIEDCAQAHGARRGRSIAGTFGDVSCFSFYPTKNLGACGDAGAVLTDNPELARAVGELRQYGWTRKYEAGRSGGRNSRMDEIQAGVLRIKLPRLNDFNARRRSIVARYRAAVADDESLVWPNSLGDDYVAHLCVVRAQDRDGLSTRLKAHGIDTAIHYPIPDHRQPAMREYADVSGSLPNTDTAVDQILTLPCFPEQTEEEIETVCAALRVVI